MGCSSSTSISPHNKKDEPQKLPLIITGKTDTKKLVLPNLVKQTHKKCIISPNPKNLQQKKEINHQIKPDKKEDLKLNKLVDYNSLGSKNLSVILNRPQALSPISNLPIMSRINLIPDHSKPFEDNFSLAPLSQEERSFQASFCSSSKSGSKSNNRKSLHNNSMNSYSNNQKNSSRSKSIDNQSFLSLNLTYDLEKVEENIPKTDQLVCNSQCNSPALNKNNKKSRFIKYKRISKDNICFKGFEEDSRGNLESEKNFEENSWMPMARSPGTTKSVIGVKLGPTKFNNKFKNKMGKKLRTKGFDEILKNKKVKKTSFDKKSLIEAGVKLKKGLIGISNDNCFKVQRINFGKFGFNEKGLSKNPMKSLKKIEKNSLESSYQSESKNGFFKSLNIGREGSSESKKKCKSKNSFKIFKRTSTFKGKISYKNLNEENSLNFSRSKDSSVSKKPVLISNQIVSHSIRDIISKASPHKKSPFHIMATYFKVINIRKNQDQKSSADISITKPQKNSKGNRSSIVIQKTGSYKQICRSSSFKSSKSRTEKNSKKQKIITKNEKSKFIKKSYYQIQEEENPKISQLGNIVTNIVVSLDGKKHFRNYTILEQIGRGSYCDVFKAFNTQEKKLYVKFK